MSKTNPMIKLKNISATPKFSRTSAMPGLSWSLEAKTTCPGSLDTDGELVDACSTCYAAKGFYRMPNVKAVRDHNKEDWKHDDWVDVMVQEVDNVRYFRWFDSGDCYHIDLAKKILEVMKRTPNTNHWFPTRQHKFKKFLPVLKEMQSLDNVVVRWSSDGINGEIIKGDCTSTIVQDWSQAPVNVKKCTKPDNDGKCGSCRSCWDKSTKTVAYLWH
jgi:hypothetical protein